MFYSHLVSAFTAIHASKGPPFVWAAYYYCAKLTATHLLDYYQSIDLLLCLVTFVEENFFQQSLNVQSAAEIFLPQEIKKKGDLGFAAPGLQLERTLGAPEYPTFHGKSSGKI